MRFSNMFTQTNIIFEPLVANKALLLLILTVHKLDVARGTGLGGELSLADEAPPGILVGVPGKIVLNMSSTCNIQEFVNTRKKKHVEVIKNMAAKEKYMTSF